MKAIYAVRDKLAGMLIGNVLTFAHDAPAARFFRDAINDEQSPCSKHPGDYELVKLVEFRDDGSMHPDPSLVRAKDAHGFYEPVVVLTGAAVIAMQAEGLKAVNA